MAYHSGNFLSYFHIYFNAYAFLSLSYKSPLQYQATQLNYILNERLKELAEDADREKALKDVTNASAKEKGKAIEKKAQASEKGR